MNRFQIALLVFASLVLAGQVLNIIFDYRYTGWILAFSWISTIINFFVSLTVIYAIARIKEVAPLKISLIFYYITDLFTLFAFIMFIKAGIFNYPKLVNFLIITPLIVVLNIYVYKLSSLDSNNPSQQLLY